MIKKLRGKIKVQEFYIYVGAALMICLFTNSIKHDQASTQCINPKFNMML